MSIHLSFKSPFHETTPSTAVMLRIWEVPGSIISSEVGNADICFLSSPKWMLSSTFSRLFHTFSNLLSTFVLLGLYVSILCVCVHIYILYYIYIYWDFHSTHCFDLYKNSYVTCFGNKCHHQAVLMSKIKTITYVVYNKITMLNW
jgi:hypothetical protein